MPSSGGSVSDAPTNKVVKGQKHYLAYITPDEGKSLVDQGGQEVLTDSGIPAYPGHWGGSSTSSSSSQNRSPGHPGNQGNQGNQGYQTVHDTGAVSQTPSHTAPSNNNDNEPTGRQDGPGTTAYNDPLGTMDQTSDNYIDRVTADELHVANTGEHKDGTPADQEEVNLANDKIAAGQEMHDVKFKEQYGSGQRSGSIVFNEETGRNEIVKDFTFKEHWDNRPDAVKWSPTLSLLYASGKNAQEYIDWKMGNNPKKVDGPKGRNMLGDMDPLNTTGWKEKGLHMSSVTGEISSSKGAEFIPNENEMKSMVAPYAPFMVSGTKIPTSSPAANWYQNLGSTGTNPLGHSLATAYASAKAKIAQTLGNPTAITHLAVNQSPFYDWLKKNSLDRGIL